MKGTSRGDSRWRRVHLTTTVGNASPLLLLEKRRGHADGWKRRATPPPGLVSSLWTPEKRFGVPGAAGSCAMALVPRRGAFSVAGDGMLRDAPRPGGLRGKGLAWWPESSS